LARQGLRGIGWWFRKAAVQKWSDTHGLSPAAGSLRNG
jgi:hypothetical protein